MPNIRGGFDLMAVDIERQRLFVSAEDNHTVEVADLKARKPVASIPDLNEPKWVVYRPDENMLYVATGKDGKVTGVDATTYKVKYTFSTKGLTVSITMLNAIESVSTGEGFINVISQATPDRYQLIERVPTTEGAGTSLYVPNLNLLIVATPQVGNRQAALRLYRPTP